MERRVIVDEHPYEPPRFSLALWIRVNLALALAIMAGASAIFGGIITVTLWYASVSGIGAKVDRTDAKIEVDLEPKITTMRHDIDVAEADIKRLQENIIAADKRMNDLRAAMDESAKAAEEVRRKLDVADALASEARARLDERVKGLEGHSVPLPLVPRGGR